MTVNQTPAGWYADPQSADRLRYWNGARWTEHVHPPMEQPAAGAAPAGWYPDPGGSHRRRYWDGERWTAEVEATAKAEAQQDADEQAPLAEEMAEPGKTVQASDQHPPAPAALGWFEDPKDSSRWRLREGAQWTEHTAPRHPVVASGPPPPVKPPQVLVPANEPLPATPEAKTSRVGRMFGKRTDQEKAAEAEFQQLLSLMIAGRVDLAGLAARLEGAAQNAGIRDRKARSLQEQAFRALAARVLEDDILSLEEEEELLLVAQTLGIPDADLGTRFGDVFEQLFVAKVNDGRLPVVPDPRLMAKADETVHHEVAAALMKEVIHREFRGGSSGVSVPIGLGIRVRTGGMRGRSVVTGTSLEAADQGVLSITDRRVVFLGAKKTQESRYDRMVGLEVFNDGVRLAVSNRQNASLFQLGNGPMSAAVINGAMRVRGY